MSTPTPTPTYRLQIVQVVKNDHNGHLAIHARIVEQNGEEAKLGAVESHGIEIMALDRLHHGDAQEWLRVVARRMVESHIRRSRHHSDLQQLQGKIIDIAIDPSAAAGGLTRP